MTVKRHRTFASCKGCDAHIRWHKTMSGNWLCLDALPNPDGNVAVDDQNVAIVLGSPLDVLKDHENTERFMPHWKSCPYAARFRREAPP